MNLITRWNDLRAHLGPDRRPLLVDIDDGYELGIALNRVLSFEWKGDVLEVSDGITRIFDDRERSGDELAKWICREMEVTEPEDAVWVNVVLNAMMEKF